MVGHKFLALKENKEGVTVGLVPPLPVRFVPCPVNSQRVGKRENVTKVGEEQ